MCRTVGLCFSVLFLFHVFDGVVPRNVEEYSSSDVPPSYPRGTDLEDWRHKHGPLGDPVPDHDYSKTLSSRGDLPSTRQKTRNLWVTQQSGSASIPYTGSTVRITPRKEPPKKSYKGRIIATVYDGPKRGGRRKYQLRNAGSSQDQWQYSQDQPPTLRSRPQPCVRCPGDRAILATKGANTVLMDTPPIIPCHPWSSIEKVKSEVLAGPQPGTQMAEGSHKMVIRLFRHKRTLATCVIRYNVIVRNCPDLELDSGVIAECPMGKAWGSRCNLTCSPGYRLEGDSNTECSDDLEWTGNQPQCVLSTGCLSPISPDNGHLSCRTPQHQSVSLQGGSVLPDGTVCHFRCHPGYIVPPELANFTRIRCIAGSWDRDQDPVCVETNQVEEEDEFPPEITVDEALRLDGKGCPENYCLNGGKCLTILKEPMCSCQFGYSGHQCQDEDTSLEIEDNTIT